MRTRSAFTRSPGASVVKLRPPSTSPGSPASATRSRDAPRARFAGRVYALLTGLIRRYDFETIVPKTSRLHEDEREHEIQQEHEHEHQHEIEHEHEHEHEHEIEQEHKHEHQLDNQRDDEQTSTSTAN